MSSVDGDSRDARFMGAGRDFIRQTDMDSSMTYTMDKQRGLFVLINNRKFDKRIGMSERTGTDEDATNLIRVFNKMGFRIMPNTNLKALEMRDLMVKVAGMDHSDYSCFAAAFLSHGDSDSIYGTDQDILIDALIAPFKKCQSLVGKPKLFFIQACRGDKLDHGNEIFLADSANQPETVRIPLEADFLYVYSTVPGYFSWRNCTKGSWFVQALCKKLEEQQNNKINFLTLLTRVNYQVAFEFESSASRPEMNRKKQIPSIVSMLTKDLYLTPY